MAAGPLHAPVPGGKSNPFIPSDDPRLSCVCATQEREQLKEEERRYGAQILSEQIEERKIQRLLQEEQVEQVSERHAETNIHICFLTRSQCVEVGEGGKGGGGGGRVAHIDQWSGYESACTCILQKCCGGTGM